MKKIGIITIHKSPNYGATLQAYALWSYLNNLGYDVEIIDLYRSFFNGYVDSKKHRPYKRESFLQCLKRNLKVLFKFFTFKAQTSLSVVVNYPEKQIRQKRFEVFNRQIKYSHPYRGIDEIYRNPPKYDTYITGSDQVWNPTLGHCLEPYFLTFVKHGKKISYASSIGIAELTPKESRMYRQWLKTYDVISVRERQAQLMLRNITKREIFQVADPAFLLDKDYWKSIAITPSQKDYILLFLLDYQQNMVDYALMLANQSYKTLVVLCQEQPDDLNKRYVVVRDAGPKEFLGYISRAEMVIGDSFHGTVFSIIMESKNFFTYISPWNLRGSRIIDLLHKYNAEDHLLQPGLNQTWSELSSIIPNNDEINRIFLSEQSQARRFLAQNV